MIRVHPDAKNDIQLSLFDEEGLISQESNLARGQGGTLADLLSDEQVWRLACAIERKYRYMDNITQFTVEEIEKACPRIAQDRQSLKTPWFSWYWNGDKSDTCRYLRDFDFSEDGDFWRQQLGEEVLTELGERSEHLWDKPEQWAEFWLGNLKGDLMAGNLPFEVPDVGDSFAPMDAESGRLIKRMDRVGARIAVHTHLMSYLEKGRLDSLRGRDEVSERGFVLLKQFEKVPEKNGVVPSGKDFWMLASGMQDGYTLLNGEGYAQVHTDDLAKTTTANYKHYVLSPVGEHDKLRFHGERYNSFLRTVMSQDDFDEISALDFQTDPQHAITVCHRKSCERVPQSRVLEFMELCRESNALCSVVCSPSIRKMNAVLAEERHTAEGLVADKDLMAKIGHFEYTHSAPVWGMEGLLVAKFGKGKPLSDDEQRTLSDYYEHMLRVSRKRKKDKPFLGLSWVNSAVGKYSASDIVFGRNLAGLSYGRKNGDDSFRFLLIASLILRVRMEHAAEKLRPRKELKAKKELLDRTFCTIIGRGFVPQIVQGVKQTSAADYDLSKPEDVQEMRLLDGWNLCLNAILEVARNKLCHGVGYEDLLSVWNDGVLGDMLRLPSRVFNYCRDNLDPERAFASVYESEAAHLKEREQHLLRWCEENKGTLLSDLWLHKEGKSVGRRKRAEKDILIGYARVKGCIRTELKNNGFFDLSADEQHHRLFGLNEIMSTDVVERVCSVYQGRTSQMEGNGWLHIRNKLLDDAWAYVWEQHQRVESNVAVLDDDVNDCMVF